MSDVLVNAYRGGLVADAFSMPVHWYYDCAQMDRDYGKLVEIRNHKHFTLIVFYGAHGIARAIRKETFYTIKRITGASAGCITINFYRLEGRL